MRRSEDYALGCFRSVADSGDPEAMVLVIDYTLRGNRNAPTLSEALHYAERLDANQDPRATELLRKLNEKSEERRAKAQQPPPPQAN